MDQQQPISPNVKMQIENKQTEDFQTQIFANPSNRI
jgi:hypothetical protein